MVQVAIEIASKILCFGLLITQGTLLNAFLAKIHHSVWWAWFTADIIIIAVWSISLAMVRKSFKLTKLKLVKGDQTDCIDHKQPPDEIKYSYLAWLVYVIFLCPRVLLIFLNLDGKVKDEDALGSNLLNITVACTPLVYLSLVYGFHNAESFTSRILYIQSIAHSGTLDLFDSVDLLELLFEEEHGIKIPSGFVTAIVFFASINWFLPTLGLTGLRIKTIAGRVASFHLKAVNIICVLALVNIPNLVIRALLWSKFNADVSVLIMKNVMCFFLGLYELLEYFGENPPQQCDKCRDWFDHVSITNHREACHAKYGRYGSVPVGVVANEHL